MEIKAHLRYLRIAPRKVRLVADLIRGKGVVEAQAILNFTTKKAALPLLKLLKSAIANAKHNFQIQEESNLYISKITVDEGPKYKRWMPRARGQVSEIQKKTSHITLILKPIKEELVKREKKEEEIVIKEEKEELKSEKEEARKEKEVPLRKKRPVLEIPKPKIEKAIKRIFRRKAI